MMSDKPDIDAIKARLAAATPGPWELVDFPVMFPRVQSIAEDKSNICETWGWADAKFIAHAPADIAALLAEVERLQDKIAGLEYDTELAIEDKCAWLAEVERLQRERAEWRDRADALMTEQMTQMRDLTAEVEALRARLTITDELLKTAARAAREAAGVNSKTMRNLREHYLDSWMTVTRAALLAAGMTDAALDAAEEGR